MSDQDHQGSDEETEKAAERKRRQEVAFAEFDRQAAERRRQEAERSDAARAAAGKATGAAQAPAGWYPHPTMAATQRYWDGSAWTDNVAPANTTTLRKPVDEKKLKTVAWAIGLAFLLPVLFITFLASPTYGGETCGTWISPTWTDLELTLRQSRAAMEGGGALADARLAVIADRCNATLGTHQLISLILIGLGIGSRLAVPAIVRAVRD